MLMTLNGDLCAGVPLRNYSHTIESVISAYKFRKARVFRAANC